MTHKEVHSSWRQTTTNVWSFYQTQTIAPQSNFPEAVALPPLKNAEAPPPLSLNSATTTFLSKASREAKKRVAMIMAHSLMIQLSGSPNLQKDWV